MTKGQGRQYTCVVEWRNSWTMEMWKDFVLGHSGLILRDARQCQRAGGPTTMEQLPPLFRELFGYLYTATKYYLSADPRGYGHAGREEAREAIEKYGRRVCSSV